MGRLASTLIATVCIATVGTQALAAGVLWWHGRLTPAAWTEIVAALDGNPAAPSGAPAEPTEPAAPPERVPTYEEVLERRALAALELADRTEQLRSAARTVAAESEAVLAAQAALAAERAAFAEELAAVRADLQSEATEQARGLLKGMGPQKSVGYLMTLPDLSVVTLMKGLDERTASKTLASFAGGTEQEKAKGAAIFAALQAGEPEASAVDAAADRPDSPPPRPGPPGAPGG